jgi:hypothetical protein
MWFLVHILLNSLIVLPFSNFQAYRMFQTYFCPISDETFMLHVPVVKLTCEELLCMWLLVYILLSSLIVIKLTCVKNVTAMPGYMICCHPVFF